MLNLRSRSEIWADFYKIALQTTPSHCSAEEAAGRAEMIADEAHDAYLDRFCPDLPKMRDRDTRGPWG